MFENAERLRYRHYPDAQVLSLTISSSANARRRSFVCVSRSINRYILFAIVVSSIPIKRLESDGTPMGLCQNGVACAVHMQKRKESLEYLHQRRDSELSSFDRAIPDPVAG